MPESEVKKGVKNDRETMQKSPLLALLYFSILVDKKRVEIVVLVLENAIFLRSFLMAES